MGGISFEEAVHYVGQVVKDCRAGVFGKPVHYVGSLRIVSVPGVPPHLVNMITDITLHTMGCSREEREKLEWMKWEVAQYLDPQVDCEQYRNHTIG